MQQLIPSRVNSEVRAAHANPVDQHRGREGRSVELVARPAAADRQIEQHVEIVIKDPRGRGQARAGDGAVRHGLPLPVAVNGSPALWRC